VDVLAHAVSVTEIRARVMKRDMVGLPVLLDEISPAEKTEIAAESGSSVWIIGTMESGDCKRAGTAVEQRSAIPQRGTFEEVTFGASPRRACANSCADG
jgi:hypothetical protein